LYQADGYAVKELLKIVSVLYKAIESDDSENHDEEEDHTSNFNAIDVSSKVYGI